MNFKEKAKCLWVSLLVSEWADSVVQVNARHKNVRHAMCVRVSDTHVRHDGSYQVVIYLEKTRPVFFEAELESVVLSKYEDMQRPQLNWSHTKVPYDQLPSTAKISRVEMPWTKIAKRAVTIARFCWGMMFGD